MNTAQNPKSPLPVQVSLLRGGNVKSSWSIGQVKPKFTIPATLQPSQILAMASASSAPSSNVVSVPIVVSPPAPTISLSSVPQCSLCNGAKKNLVSSASLNPALASTPSVNSTVAVNSGSDNTTVKVQKPPSLSLGRRLDPWHITQSTAPAHELFPPRLLKNPTASSVISPPTILPPPTPSVSVTLPVKKVVEEKISVPATNANAGSSTSMGMKVGMLSTATWGRLYWGMMNAQAYYYNIAPTEQDRVNKLKWFEATIPTIPCPTCRHSAEAWCRLHPLLSAVENQWTLTKWVRDFENDVRSRTTRKPPLTPEQISARYDFPTVPQQP